MVVLIEYSPPFRARPKLERLGQSRQFGSRVIWLWFSAAVIPRLDINAMARAWMEEGARQERRRPNGKAEARSEGASQ